MAELLGDAILGHAERQPDRAAFRSGDVDVTYGELVTRSNRLATALRADGVRPGDLVGILMGKSPETPVAVHGILAAGAGYVPIDPSAPAARQAAITADCRLRHVVTDPSRAERARRLAPAVNATTGGPLHLYGADDAPAEPGPGSIHQVSWAEVATKADRRPSPGADSDRTAYVIFTSGSTGTPKGIVHTHRSGLAYAEMAAEMYGLRADDRLSNFPPLHFDQSTFDFFSGPLVGATTVLIGTEHQLVPASLAQLIEAERLTVWYSVPLALVQLLLYGALDKRDHTSLRWVIYGGEPFPLGHLRDLMAAWPQARFSNCYGPAETNQCTYHHVEPLGDADVTAGRGVPIGRACPGMDVLVVSPDGEPVEPGEVGELIVHSPTTMVGYWERPAADRAAFLDRPGPDGPRRYYRTGDLARLDEADRLEFLGRRDRQVKARGHRVELDEVEAVLASHDGVAEVAVTGTPGDDPGEGALIVAHVSGRPGTALDPRSLRRHASGRLPRYAVPTSIHLVDEFPRTTSGKVDYRALVPPPMEGEGR